MGDWYDFDVRLIDGKEISGFCYQNADTGWQEVFVEMTSQQCNEASQIQKEYEELRKKQYKIIKGWIGK